MIKTITKVLLIILGAALSFLLGWLIVPQAALLAGALCAFTFLGSVLCGVAIHYCFCTPQNTNTYFENPTAQEERASLIPLTSLTEQAPVIPISNEELKQKINNLFTQVISKIEMNGSDVKNTAALSSAFQMQVSKNDEKQNCSLVPVLEELLNPTNKYDIENLSEVKRYHSGFWKCCNPKYQVAVNEIQALQDPAYVLGKNPMEQRFIKLIELCHFSYVYIVSSWHWETSRRGLGSLQNNLANYQKEDIGYVNFGKRGVIVFVQHLSVLPKRESWEKSYGPSLLQYLHDQNNHLKTARMHSH